MGGLDGVEFSQRIGFQLLQQLGGRAIERIQLLMKVGFGRREFGRDGVQSCREGGHPTGGGGHVVGQQCQLGSGGFQFGPQVFDVGDCRRFHRGDSPVDLLDSSLHFRDVSLHFRYVLFDTTDDPTEILELVIYHIDFFADGLDVGLEVGKVGLQMGDGRTERCVVIGSVDLLIEPAVCVRGKCVYVQMCRCRCVR